MRVSSDTDPSRRDRSVSVPAESAAETATVNHGQGKVGQEEEKSLRAPAKMESLEGAATCELEGEHSVWTRRR